MNVKVSAKLISMPTHNPYASCIYMMHMQELHYKKEICFYATRLRIICKWVLGGNDLPTYR
jgi:hypothetical protein